MAVIRPMRVEDVDAVRELDVRAFAAYARRFGPGPNHPRTRENVIACRALNPAGCFVAEEDAPVGYIFSRVWGKLGWIGVFGVAPDRHGHGVGHQLLAAAIAGLQAAGCTTIGLETMPENYYNVGFYTRSGLRPAYATLALEKPVQAPAQPPLVGLLSDLGERGLAAVSEVSRSAIPGLDYAVEARNAQLFAWGETLLIGWPEPWAAAIVRTVAKREGIARCPADVAALAVRAGARERVGEALGAVETFAATQGLQTVRVTVNSADRPTLSTLLTRGFRVVLVALRLMIEGEYGCPPGVELSRWAM